mmetsp:Transcript_15534/g.36593  ORF Transcript_15534/g.36593 Transcript_15534/m.36593 type:complete len:278 (-) Transcript_15534:641-1474(-)
MPHVVEGLGDCASEERKAGVERGALHDTEERDDEDDIAEFVQILLVDNEIEEIGGKREEFGCLLFQLHVDAVPWDAAQAADDTLRFGSGVELLWDAEHDEGDTHPNGPEVNQLLDDGHCRWPVLGFPVRHNHLLEVDENVDEHDDQVDHHKHLQRQVDPLGIALQDLVVLKRNLDGRGRESREVGGHCQHRRGPRVGREEDENHLGHLGARIDEVLGVPQLAVPPQDGMVHDRIQEVGEALVAVEVGRLEPKHALARRCQAVARASVEKELVFLQLL